MWPAPGRTPCRQDLIYGLLGGCGGLRRQSRTHFQSRSGRTSCAREALFGVEAAYVLGRWCFSIWHSIFVWVPCPEPCEATRLASSRDTRSPAPGLVRCDDDGSVRAGADTAVLDGAEQTRCRPVERSLGRHRPVPPRVRLAEVASRIKVLAQRSQGPSVLRALTHAPVSNAMQLPLLHSNEVKLPRTANAK